MNGLSVVEWLRPLVQTKPWDYVVVWKYGDDPTRFIEWIGCCCRGSCSVNIDFVKSKEKKSEVCHLAPICRDNHFQHHVRTKACEALAQLPFALSLYSGLHGEVAISQQSRWLTQDSIGTQVLLPIVGGLVELFTEKLIPMDRNIVEFITAQGCVSLKQEAISAQSYTDLNINEHLPLREQCSQWWPTPMSTLTPNVHQPATKQCSSHPSIEGSPSGANRSTEEPSFDSKIVSLISHEYLKPPVRISPIPKTKTPKYNNKTSGKQQRNLSSHCSNGEDVKSKAIKEPQAEVYQAKNLVTERNRRNKIKKGLFTLRSLVPKITKMDRASILADAVDHITELQMQVKELKDEIRVLEAQDCEKNTPQLRIPLGMEQEGARSNPLNQSSSRCTEKMQTEVQAEVYHITNKDFLIKLYCEQKQCGFSKLMETIHSIGLQVDSANMTTFDGKVLNILTVKATNQDIQPKKLKEYLLQKISDNRQISKLVLENGGDMKSSRK